MEALFLSLQSEFLKTRKTLGFWSAILLPLVICGLVFTGFYFNSAKLEKYPPMVLWLQYMGAVLGVMGTLLLPMFVIFISYSVNSIEHRSDTWKSLFSLPIPKWTIYSSKFLYAVFLVALCLFLFASFILLSGNLLSVLKPGLKFNDYSVTSLAFQLHLKLFLASLGILSIQFLFSLIWADFLKPMGIGFICFVGAMIGSAVKWKYIWTIPYAHPLMAVQSGSAKSLTGNNIGIEIMTKEIYLGLAVAAVMFVLGYFVVSKKSVK